MMAWAGQKQSQEVQCHRCSLSHCSGAELQEGHWQQCKRQLTGSGAQGDLRSPGSSMCHLGWGHIGGVAVKLGLST